MEVFLNELKLADRNNLTFNHETLSFLAYIASLSEEGAFTPNDIETASQIVYHISTMAIGERESHYLIENLLYYNDRNQAIHHFYDGDCGCRSPFHNIIIRHKWLFQLIVLNSIKHSHILSNNKDISQEYQDVVYFLRSAVIYITKYILIENPKSVHLLRTLLLILTKHSEILTGSLRFFVLGCMSKVALSPIKGFKQYARNISKITISRNFIRNMFLSESLKINLFPLRNIDTCDLVKLLTKDYIRINRNNIINKVLELFLNNTESKDGGLLYESVLFYSFEEWKVQIWPLFMNDLKHVEYEGEFLQSLLKYWIPLNVSTYKDEFYIFLKDEQIDTKVRAYALLESRRKGCASINDVSNIFCNIEMINLRLRIVSTYHKKSLCPNINEVTIVQNYLYSNLNRVLEIEEINSLQSFFSQVFLHAHIYLRKSKENFVFYATIIDNIYRYCYSSLKTDFYEVGAQLLLILWNISTGSHKSLNVPYKIEKKDFYEEGKNEFYKELQSRHLWKFDNEILTKELLYCFIQNQEYSANLTKLLYKYYLNEINIVDVKYLRNIINTESAAKLQNIEKIKNHSEILSRNTKYRKETLVFLEDLQNSLSTNLDVILDACCDESIFKNVIILEIITVATKNNLEVQISHQIIEKCLDVIDAILENKFLSSSGYKTTKVLEAFINSLMLYIIQNKDTLWTEMNKKKVINHMTGIIQRSNMKRPVSLSVEVLKHLGAKMEETEPDRTLKMQFLGQVLQSLYKSPVSQDLRIRRNPESRLVIHAMCLSEKAPNKPLLNWALNFLLDVISDAKSPDSSVASSLHSIEILVSDNNLHNSTLPFIYDIIVQCIELFRNTSWIVRNADLQLTKALIERFYGVSINSCDRPKNIEDLIVLFPQLCIYFFKIMSADELDERALLVFQFFFEGQIRPQLFTQDILRTFQSAFLDVFLDIIKTYPNNYGKMAARAYTSLCTVRCIPSIVLDTAVFLIGNIGGMRKNIFANFAFLLRELYDKYTNTSMLYVDKEGVGEINSAITDLLKHLQSFDGPLFNFLLFRIKPTRLVLKEIEVLDNGLQDDYEKRLWMHNYIPFLLVNAKPCQISNILNKILSLKLMCCMQVKVLSHLVSRFKQNEINDVLCDILNVLFQKSVLVHDNENYLLNCYFKTILLFCERTDCVIKQSLCYKYTSNLYKTMIFVLYFSLEKQIDDCDRENFYRIAEAQYLCSISASEETDIDIASTLTYFKTGAPKVFYFNLFKLVFYFSIRSSTYLEAYNFISSCTNKTYCSILSALKEFLSVRNLTRHLEDENLVAKFLLDANSYINSVPDRFENLDGYYSVETDNLVPKSFLRKILQIGTDSDST